MHVHPQTLEEKVRLNPEDKSLLIEVDMTDVTEPIAIQVMLDSKISRDLTKTEYTVFSIRPIIDENFCETNRNSCLCSDKLCKAEPSFFCKDDRFNFLTIDVD